MFHFNQHEPLDICNHLITIVETPMYLFLDHVGAWSDVFDLHFNSILATLLSNRKHEDDKCHDEIGLCATNINIILDWTSNTITFLI